MIKRGVSNFRRNLVLWPGLYIARLCLALVFTLPFFIVIDSGLSSSAYAEVLLKSWSLDVISEYFLTHENVFTSFVVVLVVYSFGMFIVKQFLNGGIYVSYLSPDRTDLKTFFGEAAALFRGNFRISLLMIPIYTILLLVGVFVAAYVPSSLFGGFREGQMISGLARFGVIYLFLVPGLLLSELMRLRLASEPGESSADALRAVLNFLKANIVRLYGLYLIYFVPFLLVWIVMENLALMVTGGLVSRVGVTLELILFQVCALLHVGQSLLFTASVAPIMADSHPGRFRQSAQGELKLD